MGFPSTFPATFPNGVGDAVADAGPATVTFVAADAVGSGGTVTASAGSATVTFVAAEGVERAAVVDAGSALVTVAAGTATAAGGDVTASAGPATILLAAADATTSPTTGGVPIGNGFPYLGFPGSLNQLPSPYIGYQPEDVIKSASHELLNGGTVTDRIGARRRFTLNLPATSDANYTLLRTLARFPGPYRYLDPVELNLLTVNQSSGGDELRTTEGVTARFQGSVSVSTAQFRSWTHSFAWATGTALAATGRGFYLYNDVGTVDATWAAVRPSTAYTLSGYLRSSAAVSMQAIIDWHGATGNYLSTSIGTGTALSTANFNTRVTLTATSPANAAYAIGGWLNSTTTGAAITVYLDEVQLEEGASASSYRVGVGTPQVVVESIAHSIPVARIVFGATLHAVELVLVEC